MVHNGRTDGRTEKVTYRVPHNNNKTKLKIFSTVRRQKLYSRAKPRGIITLSVMLLRTSFSLLKK